MGSVPMQGGLETVGSNAPSMTTMPSESVKLPKPRSMLSRSSAGRSTRSLYEMRLGGRDRRQAARVRRARIWASGRGQDSHGALLGRADSRGRHACSDSVKR